MGWAGSGGQARGFRSSSATCSVFLEGSHTDAGAVSWATVTGERQLGLPRTEMKQAVSSRAAPWSSRRGSAERPPKAPGRELPVSPSFGAACGARLSSTFSAILESFTGDGLTGENVLGYYGGPRVGARLRPQAALGRGLGALLTEERRLGSGASGGSREFTGRGERANWHPHSSWAARSRARTTDAGPASPGPVHSCQ